jgi:hypothetical protein
MGAAPEFDVAERPVRYERRDPLQGAPLKRGMAPRYRLLREFRRVPGLKCVDWTRA